MCGVVGLLSSNADTRPFAVWVRKMASAITHRGPDDEGFFESEGLAMGVRRLSIIDLSTGHQPITTPSGRYSIIFNGEIYNYREIRSELETRGCDFSTQSDTEVIVQAFAYWGHSCLQRLNGMFVFAVWDAAHRELFIARDRMGIKPLYYTQSRGVFAFASEIKALLTVPVIPREVDQQALWDYFSYRYVPGPNCLFRGILKLPPGHYMTCKLDGTLKISQYWELNYSSSESAEEGRQHSCPDQEFEDLFVDSVRKRLIADVPVGIFLSGGLDSAAVTAATKEIGVSDISTFSVGFRDGGRYDETEKARVVAHHLKTDHHEIIIGKQEFFEFLSEFPFRTDEPIADLASIPLYYVSQLARRHVKVVLSGEGADEILGGYHFDRLARNLELADFVRRWIPDFVASRITTRLPGKMRTVSKLISGGSEEYISRKNIDMTLAMYFNESEKEKLLGLKDMLPSNRITENRYRAVSHADPINQLLYTISHEWLVEDLLMKADKMTMANSLELRVPFLDHRLVEWSARLPASDKVARLAPGRYSTKSALRRYLSSRVPDSIVNQPKLGFSVPAYQWLIDDSSGFLGDVLFETDGFVKEWCDENYVRKLVARRSNTLVQHRLWSLIIVSLWYRSYFIHDRSDSSPLSRVF